MFPEKFLSMLGLWIHRQEVKKDRMLYVLYLLSGAQNAAEEGIINGYKKLQTAAAYKARNRQKPNKPWET